MFAHRLIITGIIVLGLCENVYSKIYDRCELAAELRNVHEIPDNQLATWVCIARHESDYNTSAINHGSGDHGLFQISQLFWCSPPGYACGVSCNDLRNDDIEDDVICSRRVYREHKRLSGDGFNAWVVYGLYCRDKQYANTFLDGCFTDGLKTSVEKEMEKPLPTVNYFPQYTKTATTVPTTIKVTKKVTVTTAKPITSTTRKIPTTQKITTTPKLTHKNSSTTIRIPVTTSQLTRTPTTTQGTRQTTKKIHRTTVIPVTITTRGITATRKPATRDNRVTTLSTTTKKANGGVHQLQSSEGKPLIPTEENDEFVYAISRTGYKFARF